MGLDITGITIQDLEKELERRREGQVRILRDQIRFHLTAIRDLEQEAEDILARSSRSRLRAPAQVRPQPTTRLRTIGDQLYRALKDLGAAAKPDALQELSGLSAGEYRSAVNYLISSGKVRRLGHARGTTYIAL